MTDLGSLSPRARAAIASIGSADDLQRRTTLRQEDVAVATSWLPVHRSYESTVIAPASVLVELRARHVPWSFAYATRAAADAGHDAVCARILEVLRDLAHRNTRREGASRP